MRTVAQYILSILFLVFIVEFLLVAPMEIKENAEQTKPIANSLDAHGQDVGQAMEGIHVIESKNENKDWELWADSAIGFRDQGDLALKKVRATFFSREGVTFNVVGEKGSVLTKKKNMTVDGEVVTKSSNGYVFKTAQLTYDSGHHELSSPMPVEVSGPRDGDGQVMLIKGREMSADLDLGLVVIQNEVKAKKSVEANKTLSISAQKVQLSGRDRGIQFSGNVVIDINGVRATGPAAMFHYDSKTAALRSIELEGGVKVSDFSKWATSDRLKINLAKNEFVFDGRPRVVQDNDEVRGDRIIFIDGGKKVKVQNAKIKVSPDSLNQGNRD